MKVYKTQSEVEKDVKDGTLTIKGDVRFECNISILASIKVISGSITARNIDAGNINAGDIKAGNIYAGNITAWNITARNITVWDIDAWNINAGDIKAKDIKAGSIDAWNIDAENIDARNIIYYAFCLAYNSIQCLSIKARRKVHAEPICLDGKLTIKAKGVTK